MTTLQEVMIATVNAVPNSAFSCCDNNPAISWQPTCCQAFPLVNAGASSAEWRKQQDLDVGLGISAALCGSTMSRSTTDPAAASAAKKSSVETMFTVCEELVHLIRKVLPAARSAAEAVSEVLWEGVVSH